MSSGMHTFRSSLLSAVIACMSALTFFLGGCEEDERVPRDYPRVRTLEVTNITGEGALFSAEVYDAGNVEITGTDLPGHVKSRRST